MFLNPIEMAHASAASERRNALERRMGVYDNHGSVSRRHGRDVRDWPVADAETLARAENDERDAYAALRAAQGKP